EGFHHAAEVKARMERLCLLKELLHQPFPGDHGIAWNVVDRLFRVKLGALSARLVEGVDDGGGEVEEAEVEYGKKADRPCPDDDHVGLDNSGFNRGDVVHRHTRGYAARRLSGPIRIAKQDSSAESSAMSKKQGGERRSAIGNWRSGAHGLLVAAT